MSKDNLLMAVRITLGIILTVIIAQLIGLQFAASTCIVTMLGIHATKRETLKTAGKRLISILYTIAIAVLIYLLMGNALPAFCISLAILTFLTYAIGWNGTLSINVVVLVHLFIQDVPFSGGLLLNEFIRVMLGLVIALAVNFRLPTKENEFRKDMDDIENTIRVMLHSFAEILRGKGAVTDELGEHLKSLGKSLDSGMDNAYAFANNDLSPHAQYYMHYIALRKTETFILYNIYLYLKKLDKTDSCTCSIADYVDSMADCIEMERPLDDVHRKLEIVNKCIDELELPKNKDDMKNISLVFYIKGNLERMVAAKMEFIDELDPEAIKRYWKYI